MPGSITFACTHAAWATEREPVVEAQRVELSGQLIVVEDVDRAGVWPTVRRTLLAALEQTPRDGWVVGLQDDMLPAVGFVDAVRRIVARRPAAIVHLWGSVLTRRQKDSHVRARKRQVPWIRTSDPFCGSNAIMPAGWLTRCLAWADHHIDPDWFPDDQRFAWYLTHVEPMPSFNVAPSLVEHQPVPSLINARDGRVSPWFCPDLARLPGDWWERDGVVPDKPHHPIRSPQWDRRARLERHLIR